MSRPFFRSAASACAILILPGLAIGQEPVFSGPQAGEKLNSFKAEGVFDEQSGKEFDPVAAADGKPLLILFVHEITRPSVGVLRVVSDYADKLKDQGLATAVVFLGDDKTALEDQLKRARQALPAKAQIGISVDGAEGPGAYGLNRNVALTVLVGKEGAVTANFALVQPSVQADAPKIAAAVAETVGVEPPSEKDLSATVNMGRPAARDEMPAELATLLRAIINKMNTPEQVDSAVKQLEDYLADKPEEKQRVGDIARRIIDGGVLENYGTEPAREHIQRWAKEFGERKEGTKPDSPRP